jgi:hypothetical protein
MPLVYPAPQATLEPAAVQLILGQRTERLLTVTLAYSAEQHKVHLVFILPCYFVLVDLDCDARLQPAPAQAAIGLFSQGNTCVNVSKVQGKIAGTEQVWVGEPLVPNRSDLHLLRTQQSRSSLQCQSASSGSMSSSSQPVAAAARNLLLPVGSKEFIEVSRKM